jgi:hypothetical protein
MEDSSGIRSGLGEGTTRRQRSPQLQPGPVNDRLAELSDFRGDPEGVCHGPHSPVCVSSAGMTTLSPYSRRPIFIQM